MPEVPYLLLQIQVIFFPLGQLQLLRSCRCLHILNIFLCLLKILCEEHRIFIQFFRAVIGYYFFIDLKRFIELAQPEVVFDGELADLSNLHLFFSGGEKVIGDDGLNGLWEVGVCEELRLLGEDLCGACEVELAEDADDVGCLAKVKSTTDFFYSYM